MESVTLTGDALRGISHHLCAAQVDALPTTVLLGRVRPKAMPNALRFASYCNLELATGLPGSVDWYTKAAKSLAHMYANDRLGDCVIAGKGHLFGVWSANDLDAPELIVATDQEIVDQYHKFCGLGDNGCNIADVLDQIKAGGFLMGGKRYKIDGYVSVDWRNKDLTKATIALLGGGTIGINLPSAWTSANVWDVTTTGIVGGHDVTVCGYNDQGPVISSWGRVYQMTWAAFMSTRWVEEFWAILSPSWYNSDKLAPNGVDVATLKADLAKLTSGTLPDVPDPNNPPDTTDWFV